MNERISSAARMALILILPALACSGSSDNKGTGTPGTGNTPGGGGGAGGLVIGGGSGGNAGGNMGGNMGGGGLVLGGNKDAGAGGSTASGGSTGSGGTVGGAGAQMKFCNGLSLSGGGNIKLSLQVGDPPLVMTADSGTCSTALNTACKTVPAGTQQVVMVDDTGAMVASGMVMVGAGEHWLMLATLDDMTMEPTVIGGALKPEFMCATVNPFMSGGGGGPGGLGGMGGMP